MHATMEAVPTPDLKEDFSEDFKRLKRKFFDAIEKKLEGNTDIEKLTNAVRAAAFLDKQVA